MKLKKYSLLLSLILLTFKIFPELKFNAVAIDQDNNFLFNSIEIIGTKELNKTLFLGNLKDDKIKFSALTFYPEKLFYSSAEKKLYIYNRMGLYEYNFKENIVKIVEKYQNFANKDEYVIYEPSEISFSPNFCYFLAKISNSSLKANLVLFDLKNNTSYELIKDIDIKPGQKAVLWSPDSNYFIYEKNNKVYYYSITDYLRKKILTEEWREIGKINLQNCQWTNDNYLYWIEKNYIYKADSNQFFSRSIYRNYLKQGNIIKKIPFIFDPSFDNFYVNENANKMIIVKNKNTIFYYSLKNSLNENIYLSLGDNYRIENAHILDNGESILILSRLINSKIVKDLLFIKKGTNSFYFKNFDNTKINNNSINNLFLSNDKKNILLTTDKGAYCFDQNSFSLKWSYAKEKIIYAVNSENEEWILGGEKTTLIFNPNGNRTTPLFASSFTSAGFIDSKTFVNMNNENFLIDNEKAIITYADKNISNISNKTDNSKYRLLTRELNKGFYKEGIYLKELYSGKYFEIIGEPKLKYSLYQPELKMGAGYYNSPLKDKFEIAFSFNCVKSSEGIIDILKKLNDLNIKSTFFINGTFMDINPELTKEISGFSHEIGNIFQYDINLTDTNFLIDKNFIRQGLSINEEKFYKITGKNFSPIWHSPMYAFNDSIIKYGKESGYSFVSYNLDSLDWVGEGNTELSKNLQMRNNELIQRILKNIKPGYIVIFNAGKNDTLRSEWLFQDVELLIAELIRSGYSFTTATEILKKYKE